MKHSLIIKRALPGMIWNHPNRQSGTLPIKLRALNLLINFFPTLINYTLPHRGLCQKKRFKLCALIF